MVQKFLEFSPSLRYFSHLLDWGRFCRFHSTGCIKQAENLCLGVNLHEESHDQKSFPKFETFTLSRSKVWNLPIIWILWFLMSSGTDEGSIKIFVGINGKSCWFLSFLTVEAPLYWLIWSICIFGVIKSSVFSSVIIRLNSDRFIIFDFRWQH